MVKNKNLTVSMTFECDMETASELLARATKYRDACTKAEALEGFSLMPPEEETPFETPGTRAESVPQKAEAALSAVPVSAAPEYTLEQLAIAAVSLRDAGKATTEDMTELLKQHGAETMATLEAAQYGAFATALRALGARI